MPSFRSNDPELSKRIFGRLLLLVSVMGLPALGPNEVLVIGKRPEAVPSDRPGQSRVIRPEDPTRFDVNSQLKREAALTLPESGETNASGFAVPRIRGHDARLTEVYLGEFLLQDPYTGLPLLNDLDLKALGELVIHQGMSPPELPSLSQIGVLQYRPRPTTKSGMETGLRGGKPYGVSGWLLGEGRLGLEEGRIMGRLYSRRHVTDGRFRYYDDNGTPYNDTDDFFAERLGGHRNSNQVVPWLQYASRKRSIAALGFWQEARTGLPGVPAREESGADEWSSVGFGSVIWKERLGAEETWALQGSLAGSKDTRRIQDPERRILGEADSGRFRVESRRVRLALERTGKPWEIWVGIAHGSAEAKGRTGTSRRLEVARTQIEPYGALRWRSSLDLSHWQWEVKAKGRRQVDDLDENRSTDLLNDMPGGKRERFSRGFATSIGKGFFGGFLYFQGGRDERPPSLLEEFGDGGFIRAGPGLEPEKIQHTEVGAMGDIGGWRLGLALFQDLIEEKIVFLPSVAQTIRATNIASTRIQGADLSVEWRRGTHEATFGLSRIEANDVTIDEDPRPLPGIPEWTGSLSLAEHYGPVTARWISRYQSEVYRDQRGDIVVPDYHVHDISVDATLGDFGLGLEVLNLFDVTSRKVSARETPANVGRTAFGDFAGRPRPGRQLRITAQVTL